MRIRWSAERLQNQIDMPFLNLHAVSYLHDAACPRGQCRARARARLISCLAGNIGDTLTLAQKLVFAET